MRTKQLSQNKIRMYHPSPFWPKVLLKRVLTPSRALCDLGADLGGRLQG